MTDSASNAHWKRDSESRICLSGSWNLLLDSSSRERLRSELHGIDAPRSCRWNLQQVESMDSAGALVLWDVWDKQLPEHLECRDEHEHWFDRLRDTEPLDKPSHPTVPHALDRFGAGAVAILKTFGGIFLLIGQLMLDVAYCARHPRVIPWREISANIYRIGIGSMLLMGVIGFLIGVVMTIQIGLELQMFGASRMMIGVMSTAVPRELGPVIVGLIMAGRTGSAMTTGIGSMHLTEEYDALRAFGSSPSLRLALPRVIGAAVSIPLLVLWTDVVAMIGAAVTTQANFGINSMLFLNELPQQVQLVNFWLGLGKGVLFGLTIALVACYFGLNSSPDTESMSRNTTLSVVTSLTLIVLFDASLGAALTNVGLL
jgi:phospholipid/cholesterol/gamma-HCH transport system permease protein